ncbi:MAG: hypothetical protein MK132_21790 [Lentisphaerales bacterium]|nr:hypothetical protein [Lentisphaerales bacterium]
MKYLVLFLLLLVSCKKESTQSTPDLTPLKQSVRETYAQIAFATYEDSLITAQKLQSEIQQFVQKPTSKGLVKCQETWLAAREPYGLTEAFRFSNGPIDSKDGLEGALNAWPLDESYIDYVIDKPKTGIVNNKQDIPEITKEVLLSLNEKGGETNISTGYHAMEFLLWGQDQVDTSLKTPGNRTHKDYLSTTPNADRRGQYLTAAAELVVEHLETLLNEWKEGSPQNYRTQFLAMDNDASLKEILNGLFNFSKGELAGERMFVALNNKDQEDEHSCFSDNTHRDIIQNFNGVKNLARGQYTRINGETVSGHGFIELITKADAQKGVQLTTALTELESLMQEIPIPFDHALTEEVLGQGKLSTIVNKLMALGDIFAQSMTLLNLSQNKL